MKNYLEKKDRYNKAFANAIMDEFRTLRYGVKSCHKEKDLHLIKMRKDLVDWQLEYDSNVLFEEESC
jgi:hypothetical protein